MTHATSDPTPEPTPTRRPLAVLAGVGLILATAVAAGYWFASRGAGPAAPPALVADSVGSASAPGAAGDAVGVPATPPTATVVATAGPTPNLAQAPPAFPDAPSTETGEFQPAKPLGEPRKGGLCDRDSLMAPRNDALHCILDNQPYDPCYRVAGESKLVICNARPAREENAFLLRLVEPPPKSRVAELPETPWVIGLVDTTCERRLGYNLVTFGDKPIRYDCRDGTYLLDLDRSHPAWAAQRVTLRIDVGAAPEVDKASWVPVRRAWW